jgi:hypothetical protein
VLVGPAFHETFAIAETCDKETFLRYMQQVEQGDRLRRNVQSLG